MCPFCFSTLGMIVVSTAAGGGVAALIAKASRRQNPQPPAPGADQRR
jgi:hypothetical protein